MSVADILEQMAQNAGRARLQRGAVIGSTIEQLAQVPGQILDDRARQQVIAQQQARQAGQDARQARGDARDEAAFEAEQKQRAIAHEIATVYHNGDPSNPTTNNLPGAIAKAKELGAPELIDGLKKQYQTDLDAARPKITQTDPTHDTWTDGVLTKPGVAKAPEVGTPAYEVWARAQQLQAPTPMAPGDYGPATPGLPREQAVRQAYDDQRAATTKPPGPGTVHDTANGLVRIGDDNTITPLGVKGYHPAPAGASPDAVTNVKDAVAGMKDGTLPPQMPGRASKDYTAILAESRRQGFDLGKANLDWTATQKHVATMNGAQQLRLNQAINSLPDMLDQVDALASQWKGGRFPVLNKANLALAKGGAYGSDVASVANQLDAQIADVTADLGNVYMGGNSPTDHALGLAGKSLNGAWDETVLHDMVKLAKTNVTIRRNSIQNTGVAGASDRNPYGSQAPPAAAAPAGMMRVVGPNGETGSMPSGNALPPGWKKQ